jgi:hypothetical protein
MLQRPGRWGVERRHNDAAAEKYPIAPCPRSSRVERRRLPAAVRQDRSYDPVNGVDMAPARDQRPLAGPRVLGDGDPRVHLPQSSVGAGGHVRYLRRHVVWAPRAEPIDCRVARGADVAVVRGAVTRGGHVPGDWGQARSVGVPGGVRHSVASWRQDRVDDKEGEAQPDAEGHHFRRRRDEVIELCVIMCGY